MADWKNKPDQDGPKYRDYGIDNTPGDFSAFSEQSDIDIESVFTDARKRKLYIYKLNNLIKNKNKPNLYFSPNVVKIGFIDLEQVIEVDGYEISDFNLELSSRNATNIQDNTTEFVMNDTKKIIFQDISLKQEYNLYVIAIHEPAAATNLDNLYIITSYGEGYISEEKVLVKEINLTRVKDFNLRDSNPIIVRIAKQLPENTKVKAITITFPRQALFGNIKAIGEIDGIEGYPRLFLEDDKVALPMLAMPIEIEPKVRILQQWMSSQILPWFLAKQFFIDKSCLPIFRIEAGKQQPETVIKDVIITKIFLNHQKQNFMQFDNYCVPTELINNKIEITSTKNFTVNGSGTPLCTSEHTISLLKTRTDITIKNDDVPALDSLNKVLLKMLDYTYNYRTNFKHAEYYSSEDKQFLYGQPKNEVAKLKENVFAGQKAEVVITNLFEEWKFENPNYINHPSVNIFKQIVIMLSEYLLCDLSINGGLNDDYKLLLPYYFELISKSILEDGKYVFKDVKVKLKSEYFEFNQQNNMIKFKNNDISQNKLFRLNENQFNWLPLINTLEANDIPSLLPKDIKLSDGNYGKNFVWSIIGNSNINNAMNLFGKGLSDLLSNFKWLHEIEKYNENKCKFILEREILNFKKIEISAIFGKGKYNIIIHNNINDIKINDIELFDNKLSSYSILEI